jgi:PAS domain S-box-containing protein
VDPETSKRLYEKQVVEDDEGVSFEEFGEATEALARVKQGELKPDAMVLGSQVGEPMRIALSLQSLAKDLAVLILSEPDAYERLSEAVRLSPFFGNQVSCCSTADGEAVATALREGVARTRHRRDQRRFVHPDRVVEEPEFVSAGLRAEPVAEAAVEPYAEPVAEPPPAPAPERAERVEELREVVEPVAMPMTKTAVEEPEEPIWLAPIGIATVDDQVQLQTLDSAARELLGLRVGEIPDGPLSRLFPDFERERLVIFVTRSLIAEKRLPPEIFELPTTDGRPRRVELTVSRMEDPADGTGAIVLLEDLTPRLRAEAEATRIAESLRRSEKQYRDLAEICNDLVWSMDLQGRLSAVNHASLPILGYRPDEVERRLLGDLLPPENRTGEVDLLERIRAGEPQFQSELTLLRKDGTPAHLRVNTVVMRDVEGKVLGATGTAQDITERKREEEAIRKGEEHMRSIVQSRPALPRAFDERRNLVAWNHECERATGYAPEEVLGKPGVWDLVFPNPEYRRRVLTEWKSRGNDFRDWEMDFTCKDGSVRTIAWSSISDRLPIPGWSSWTVGLDVTERKRSEERIEQLRAASQAIGDAEDERAALEIGLVRICELTGWSLGQTWVPKPDGSSLECGPVWHSTGQDFQAFRRASEKLTFEPGVGMAGRVWSSGKLEWLEDAGEEETFRRGRNGPAVGIQSGAAFPVLAGGDLVAVLEFFAQAHRERDERHVRLASTLARQVGTVIRLARSGEAKRQLETWARRAQRLENLGVLAGGVAHEFKDQLTNLLGNASMALMHVGPRSPARRNIQQIETTAHRAAELTNQMLAYSGKGKFVLQALDLSVVLREMDDLMQSAVPGNASLRRILADNLPAVEADVTQIRQVVMNLVTNASEAVGDGDGIIKIRTGTMEADRSYLSSTLVHENLPEGQYVFLEVSDTGPGMDEETRTRIFEPFFTLKFSGRGLGLAAALGIVRGHGGTIKVDSESGRGTTIRVLFPATNRPVETPSVRSRGSEDWRGSGKILVVDDEEKDRSFARTMLERFGFDVLTAKDGRQGVDLFRQHAGEIEAVLLDMAMPRLDGAGAFEEIRRLAPKARVILVSGQPEGECTSRFEGKGLAGFIQKPFPPMELIEKLREVLKT